MNREQLTAQAVASWVTEPQSIGRDLLREALPSMDVCWFFKALSARPNFAPSGVSLALAGFSLSAVDLEAACQSSGLRQLHALTDDLHVAADWRNHRTDHPLIVSLAKGWHPGVSTLDHFGTAASRDLVLALLDWTLTSSGLPVNDLQSELVRALRGEEIVGLISLDSVCRFLESWFALKANDSLEAPRSALPQFGVFADPALFSRPGDIQSRLLANFKVASQVKDAHATAMRSTERRLNKRFQRDLDTRDRLLAVCEKLMRVRLYPAVEELANVTLDEVLQVFRPPKDSEPEPPIGDPDIEGTPVDDPGNTGSDVVRDDHHDLSKATGDDLLDDNQEKLTTRISILESALQEAIENNENSVEAEVEIGGEEVQISVPLEPGLLDWLHTFCTEDVFGGLLQTHEPTVAVSLRQHASASPLKVEPERIAVLDGREMSLRQVFADWDSQLRRRGHEVSILADWDALVADRAALVAHLDVLFQFPLDWMAGRPEMAIVVERYFETVTRLYKQVQSHFRIMSDVDQGWAEIGLHGLLALDVMQIRCLLEDGRESWKAVVMPTHPLHLWRYQRLAAVLRGLGATLDPEDRKAVLDECRRPEQFLSVLYASTLPANKGGARLLPISSDLHGLATFENLQNACSGLDGVETLRYALDRFTVINRIHLAPFRVGVVNPPDAPKLVVELSKILNERRECTLPAMRLELFSTSSPAVRGRAAQAMAFSSDGMDVLEARLSSGRLQLQIHEEPKMLEEWLDQWRRDPLHLLVIFDEAGVSIRRSDMGLPMPMSPFCVRKVIRYQELRGTMRLDPTTDEPPFSEFMQLMNEADKGQRDSTPNAWADAENLRQLVDRVLQGEEPGAMWLALADRALPPESGLGSVRLLAKREDQRELLLLARDYRRLADLVRPAFNRWHLNVDSAQLSKLLEEGVHLTGTGILNLIKKDGTVDSNQVLGLAGTLLVARDYARRHPGALIVSVDNQIARHWLRLGKHGERCDLIALRQAQDGLVIETIEVKSTQGTTSDISSATLDKATDQLSVTLQAISDGLPGAGPNASPLSVPRSEMLKEVLVRGCLSKNILPELRGTWCGLLKRLFRQEGDPLPLIVRGEIALVALGESRSVETREVRDSVPPVTIRTLGEAEVQDLLEGDANPPPPDRGDDPPQTCESRPPQPVTPANEVAKTGSDHGSGTLESFAPNNNARVVAPTSPELAAPSPPQTNSTEEIYIPWPPQANELGMIGQDETVRQLINRLHYARDFNSRFKDTMLVGSAGVGKSSFARAIADQLLGEKEIFFSGADLKNGSMLIEKLQTEGKIIDGNARPVRVGTCVIFIDEVHALTPAVANILLSALDDARLTTIDNVDYDFGKVVFLMATTDSGRLTEAFRSRPDRVHLRNYTLDELSGILWLHGQRELDGFELTYEVCREIAARTRAQPRVAVRMLSNQLIPHFYAAVRGCGDNRSRHRIGQAMTVESVANYFESQGVDANGVDVLGRNYLEYLNSHGATAEERIRQGVGISNRGDFIEVDEYLQRLGLVTVRGGRTLTRDGRRYLQTPLDLRNRISRQS